MGVTGATGTLNAALPALLERVHTYSGHIPTAVGFGVSTRDHFLSVAQIAEGVVIGSEIITTLSRAAAGQGAEEVRKYCAHLTGRDGTNVTTREVGIVEAVNEAKEPNGVTVDKVIRDDTNGTEPGLIDQIEAANTNGHVDPAVCIKAPDLLLYSDSKKVPAISIWRVWRPVRSRVAHGLSSRTGGCVSIRAR